ncbi:hypothetical protein HY643_01170 [Candidatus Woesearchaeota archaeon]|nr:hypothetical protein [Candidatus Woesearchaeota archaeon]
MGLNNVFGTPEKLVEEEKKLEVIVSDESVIDDLTAYFAKMKNNWYGLYQGRRYFEESQKFLQAYKKITPELISKFNEKSAQYPIDMRESRYLGILFSSLIQTSYNQGFNNFKFKNVNAQFFGTFLQGKKGNPIRIEVETSNGHNLLNDAEDCSLKVRTINGRSTLYGANHCSLEAQTINADGILNYTTNCYLAAKTIKGNCSLWGAGGCVAIISKYQGENFGWFINNCTISTPKIITWLKLKASIGDYRLESLDKKGNHIKLIW